LIDVREPAEVALGVIPTAHHIPLAALHDALVSLSDQDFEAQYGFKRFAKDEEAIFYCRSGRRSRLAFAQAQELGYTHVRHYPGSWIEWEARTKTPVSKS
ncbi:Rhodanese-like domain-containing protein, partial [Dissophora ornata]